MFLRLVAILFHGHCQSKSLPALIKTRDVFDCYINFFTTLGREIRMRKPKCLRPILTSSLFVFAFFASTFTVFAQADAAEQTVYKVGDRVEVDPQAHALTYEYKTWHKATVTKIGPAGGGVHGYYVRIDAEGDSGPTDNYVMTGSNMIRPLQEAAKNDAKPATGDQEKKAGPEKEQAAAANSCPPSDEVKGTSQSDVFKSLILAQYVHKSTSEQDPTATVTFQTFKVGATHTWRAGVGGYSSDGPGGRSGTIVYPVKAVFTVCTDVPGYKPSGFRGWIKTRQDSNTFYCLKNQFGEWQCNMGEGTTGTEKSTNK
jgi:hypothetical protein